MSEVCVIGSFVAHQLTGLSRCTAPAKGIDDAIYGYRSCGHTDVLVQEFELGVLWDEYGLVGDIVVRIISPSCMSSLPLLLYNPPWLVPLGSVHSSGRYKHIAQLRNMSDTFGCLGTDL